MTSNDDKEGRETDARETRGTEKALFGLPNILRQKLAALSLPQELERRVDEGVSRALALLNLPTREEVRELQNRLDHLIARCERLRTSRAQSGNSERETS